MTGFAYGKAAPLPHDTHPRVYLSDHVAVEETPAVVDWASRVPFWPVYMNTRIGDCTCAALGHAVQAWTLYGKGNMVTLPDSAILDLYSAVSGYDPKTGANDVGAVEQNVLKYVRENGIGGHKIRAYAQLNHKDLAQMKHALWRFGTVYMGFQVPRYAEDQTAQGYPWSVQTSGQTQIVGGHAIDLQAWDENRMTVITWGKTQVMTEEFWLAYGDEAWVIITDDWLNANGRDPNGLDLTSLLAEFDGLTMHDTPSPKKTCFLVSLFRKLVS